MWHSNSWLEVSWEQKSWIGGGGRERAGEGKERAGGSTVLGPHGRDSSKTCLRWPQKGPNRTGPPMGGAWQRRQLAAVGLFPHWPFSPLAFLYVEDHKGDDN